MDTHDVDLVVVGAGENAVPGAKISFANTFP